MLRLFATTKPYNAHDKRWRFYHPLDLIVIFFGDKDMSFEEWWEKESGRGGEKLAEYNLAKDAWNAAIFEAENAVADADYNCDDSGMGANESALSAVETIKVI